MIKTQWQVIDVTRDDRTRIIATFDKEEDALKKAKSIPKDLMSDVIWTVRQVWTNAR